MTRENNTKENEPMSLPALQIDWDYYGEMLEGSDLSDAEKIEFINTIWSIVGAFVDLGFGLHPVQQSCGQDGPGPSVDPRDMICLVPAHFELGTDPASAAEEERRQQCQQ